jgi:DNA repair protein RecO (recombination protein O)
MEWSDEAIVLSARPHGETSAVAMLLTREHGRHAGLVRGGQSAKARAVYQPGNLVRANWRGRLAEHLGGYSCEAMVSHAARLFDDPPRLTALLSAAALSDLALPEREPHPACFHGFLALLEAMEGDHWAEAYVRWELGLLSELGFGLDLSSCAGGGDNDQLAYVSPRSGRAVSLAAGEPYRDRLLTLPDFLAGRGGGGRAEVAQGLALTGYFLDRHVLRPHDRALPAPRRRLEEQFGVEGR